MVLMMVKKIQVKYQELDQLISQCLEQADQIKAVYEKVRSQKETLDRTWQGGSADKFQKEMDESVLPSLKRLSNSLEEAGESLGRIKEVFLEAEKEAVSALGEGDHTRSSSKLQESGFDHVSSSPDLQEGGRDHVRFSPEIQEEIEIKGPGENKGWRTGGISINQKLVDGEYYDYDNVKKDIKIAGVDVGDYTYDAKVGTAEAGIGIEVDEDGELSAGGYFSASAGEVSADAVLGNEDFGGSVSGKVAGPSVEGFIGLKDGSVGGEIGGTLISAEGSAGVNIAGANVGVSGGVMLGAKFGFKVGKKTEVKLGLFKLGLILGKAKGVEPD
jgi:WXG100 family type VII secretion target